MRGPIEATRYRLWIAATPEQVLAALTDFGPDRAKVWRETSHPAVYRVHHLGSTEAEVTEGVPSTWSRERYDWSTPGVVVLTQLDSNVARNGLIRYRIEPDGAGSTITCERRREFYGLRGRIAGSLLVIAGRFILARQLRAGLERHAARNRISRRDHPRGGQRR